MMQTLLRLVQVSRWNVLKTVISKIIYNVQWTLPEHRYKENGAALNKMKFYQLRVLIQLHYRKCGKQQIVEISEGFWENSNYFNIIE